MTHYGCGQMREKGLNGYWFQQDGELFLGRLMSEKYDVYYPPRSPHLTFADFLLLCYLKSKVAENNHHTIDNLTANIILHSG